LKAKRSSQSFAQEYCRTFNVRPEEIIFTASVQKRIIWRSLAFIMHSKGKSFTPHFITTNIEHPGILETMSLA
jgi:cysteine sulfinate desulfinase/cysteine desulfurase-like protein